ncbi:methyltransferase family protein [Shimia isoporae]|uniref:Methyltransferase family protein n=1 Tax=Shimia isoporae TaxID=647720 RepID=A0A4R1N4E7_9RHOB|nr:class I SAM-dependent methyltransferase [Shimia isoporae]TCL00633.1 methyltransferase family protein [Shimia isoporae]
MPNFFDTDVAETYDATHGGSDPELIARTVEVLADLAADGPVLEFAVGTGRIALPLAAQGVPVSGIELSEPMVAQMRAKPGGADIPTAIGDMTCTRVAGDFALVFLVFNTIDNLTTQDAQVACFENAAAHLVSGGRFVVETLIPPLQRLPLGEIRLPFANDSDHWGVDEFDVTTQNYSSHHIWLSDGQAEHLTVPFRYAWPAELDLMARIAGMQLEHRWADWSRKPFTNLSRSHVSVWKKTG